VLGNGGIKSYEQAIEKASTRLFAPQVSGVWAGSRERACDGVMIWQAAIARPWIFTDHHPTLDERFQTILNHLELSTACEIYLHEHMNFKTIFPQPTRQALQDIINNLPNKDKSWLKVTIEFRKYLFNYITWLPESKVFKQLVATIKDRDELRSAIVEYWERSRQVI
jgi:tRNA-dihydrouridine synthase